MGNVTVKNNTYQILVVDDIPANLKLLTNILSNQGYKVRPASNGQLALRSVAVELPDLILLDVKMPDMDGYEVCQFLRADEKSRRIPVIFISALNEVPDKVKGLKAGGVDYITKPFQTAEILARIETHLTIWRLKRQLEEQNLQLQKEIGERTRSEIELQQANAKIEQIYAAIPSIIISMSTEGNITKWNPGAEKILGIKASDAVNQKLLRLPIKWEWEKVCQGLADCLYKACHIELNDIHFQYSDGRPGFLDMSVIPIQRDLRPPEGLIILAGDITARRQMEIEMTRLDRLNLVGEMAASIGHEIRNPMTSVRGFLQMFEDKYSEDKEFLDLMIEELDRANAIITEFLSLAKNKMVQLIPNKLNLILENILPLIQATATIQDKNVKLGMTNVPDLLLDEKEIRQLILNLVHNGLESMSAGGTITIRTFMEGDKAVLSIRDQGPGIAPEVLDKLGTPFLTTKEKGTGLGLAVCYGIAARHNAKIDVDTSTIGTTFYIRFTSK